MPEFIKSLTGYPNHQSPAYGGGFDGIRTYLDTLPKGHEVLAGLMVIEDAVLKAAPLVPFQDAVLMFAGTVAGVVSYVSDSTMEAHCAQLILVENLQGAANETRYPEQWLPADFAQTLTALVLMVGEVSEEVIHARVMNAALAAVAAAVTPTH